MSAPRLPDTLPLQTRFAPLGTVNVESRTVDAVWTTGATVRRSRWIGWDTAVPFDEELLVSPEAIDLTRMRAGAPVLDSHSSYSTDAIRAVVDKVWLSGEEGLATFRFPEPGTRQSADELFELVRQGIVRNVSVGYAINRVKVVPPAKEGQIERRIIERWTPYEVSFVTIPADAGAQVRSGDTRAFPVEIHGRVPVSHAAARARMSMSALSRGLAG